MNKQIDTGWESSVFIVILDICFVIIVRKRFGLISTCCSYLTHFIPMFPYIPMRSSILVSMEITQSVFTCSKSTTETPEQRLVPLLLTLNTFYTLFWCFIVDFEKVNAGWVSGNIDTKWFKCNES